ncbi:hypothetical protein CPB83DRAFT_850329 [Crepidotus variabilis]|uniref:Extracellular membrane protein CFEM domain-containing protein n=1 Tax=Crepidotus variabilis TaxID=179855 RepID=A0A9P6JSI5_9AGAR|nr:hypothetical protein CPB83DRAFT_850329 [Crepidotus variabilis]
MLSKASLAILAVAVAQVSASAIQPLLQRRSLEILYNRQSTCDSICSPFETAVNTCTTTACLCTAANTKSLQGCINCAVAASAAAIDDANTLATTYNQACGASAAGAVTVPAGGGATTTAGGAGGGTGGTTARPSVVTTPTAGTATGGAGAGTTSRAVVTVTSNPGVVPTLTQTVVKPTGSGSSDPSTSGGGDVPGGLAGGALRDVAHKGVVMVIGAIVGGALVL